VCIQELANTWRKTALYALTDEVQRNQTVHSRAQRLRRFEPELPGEKEAAGWLSTCVQLFRETISYVVEDGVPVPKAFAHKVSTPQTTCALIGFLITPLVRRYSGSCFG
jgi:hypothetical protein